MGKRIRMSNETLNCYGTWVKTDGIDLSQYKRNPVLLWMHRRGTIIGMMKDIRVENGEITGEPEFDEVTEESRMAKSQWEKGTLRMGSPNFEIVEMSDSPELLKQGQTAPTITKSKLIEFSMVDIGGNDDNIRLSREGRTLTLGSGGSPDLPVINNQQQQKKEKDMKELEAIALMMGMPATSTAEEIRAKIALMMKAQKENEELKKEVDELRLSGITQLVDNAIKEGRIDAGNKDHFINLGKAVGCESLKLTFNAMKTAVRPNQIINQGGPSTKEYTKLSEVPSDELKTIRREDPDRYRKLYKAEYGYDCGPVK